ncbi:MAG TPA: glutathione transferase GstA [Rhizomicrobium sp.]|jgi:glutathione S-transferase|nr:glutathione transferase GstA [Rhizomicrobium sp.]
MKLYYTPGACSLSPHIVIQEAGLSATLEKVDLKTHKTESGEDYYAVNPKGYVPALKLDGVTLTEGPAIVQYLADQKPESGLAPREGTIARYKLQEWLAFISSELHKSFGPLFGNAPDAVKKEVAEKIQKRFGYVEKELDGKTFLTGEDFTIADAYLFVMLFWARKHKLDLGAYPKLAALFDRIAARPRVRETLKAEGLEL